MADEMIYTMLLEQIPNINLNPIINIIEVYDYKIECDVELTIKKEELFKAIDLEPTKEDFNDFKEDFNVDQFLKEIFENKDFKDEYDDIREKDGKEILDNVFYYENITSNENELKIDCKMDIEYEEIKD